jgi:hypothetical protein
VVVISGDGTVVLIWRDAITARGTIMALMMASVLARESVVGEGKVGG